MAETRAVSPRSRSKEDEYFLRTESELLEKVRVRAAKAAERRALGEYHGVEDEEILKAFEEAGYDRETVQILHLVPILQVAWVDGEISKAERAEILKIAAARNVAEGSPAYEKLLSWLETPPAAGVLRADDGDHLPPPGALPRGEAPRPSGRRDDRFAGRRLRLRRLPGVRRQGLRRREIPPREVRRGLREDPARAALEKAANKG